VKSGTQDHNADCSAIILLASLLDTWVLSPKAERIVRDAMLYLWDRPSYSAYRSRCRRLTGLTEEDLVMAERVTRRRDPAAPIKRLAAH
jgi:hypothetical protein